MGNGQELRGNRKDKGLKSKETGHGSGGQGKIRKIKWLWTID